MQNLSILQKKKKKTHFFCFTLIFYKTFTLAYLFYTIFYLNKRWMVILGVSIDCWCCYFFFDTFLFFYNFCIFFFFFCDLGLIYIYIYIEERVWWIWDLDWFTFEEFDDLLLDLREDKMRKRVEEERDQMREER